MRIACSIAVLAYFFVVWSTASIPRPRPTWPVDKLFKESDIVLVVSHLSTRDATIGEAKAPFDDPDDQRMLTPIRSTLKTLIVLKGQYLEKEVLLNHHRFDWEKYGQKGIGNGPNLVVFEDTSKKPVPSSYMIFLRRHSNGMLLPVTGMFDPRFSVKQLVDPEMNSYGK